MLFSCSPSLTPTNTITIQYGFQCNANMDPNPILEPTLPPSRRMGIDATTQDDDDMLVIRDPATRADVEQNALTFFIKAEV